MAIPDIHTIKCLKCLSSTTVATVADVGAGQCGAVLAIARRRDTMLCIKVEICRDLTSGDERLIVLKQACRNFLVYDGVHRPREQVDLIVFQIDVRVVNESACGIGSCQVNQFVNLGKPKCRIHTTLLRIQYRRLSTVVGPTSKDRSPINALRVRNMELDCHVAS